MTFNEFIKLMIAFCCRKSGPQKRQSNVTSQSSTMATSTATYPKETSELYSSNTEILRTKQTAVSPLNGENETSETESVKSSVTIIENLNAKNTQKSKETRTDSIVLPTVQNIYGGKIQVATPDEDIAIVTKSPSSRRSKINRFVYAKLHRNNHTKSAVDKLKGKYENIAKQTNDNVDAPKNANSKNIRKSDNDNDLKTDEAPDINCSDCSNVLNTNTVKDIEGAETKPVATEDAQSAVEPTKVVSKTADHITHLQNSLTIKLSKETVEQLKNKYSPASFGYPKTFPSRIPKKIQIAEADDKKIQTSTAEADETPVPKPRLSLAKDKGETDGTIDDTPEVNSKEPEEILPVVESVVVRTITPETPTRVFASTSTLNSNFESIDNTDSNSNTLEKTNFPEIDLDSIEFAEPEDKHFIVRASSSEDSIHQLTSFLSDIVMEEKPKDKKRSSSFRRILSGSFFGKDKKKNKKAESAISDNAQNENSTFVRHAPQRHTVGSGYPIRDKSTSTAQKEPFYANKSHPCQDENDCANKRVEEQFAQMHINKFNDIKNAFARYDQRTNHPGEEYVPMDSSNGFRNTNESFPATYSNSSRVDRYIDTSSSSSTLESDKQHNTYENSLIAQAEMRQARHNENLRRSNSYRGAVPVPPNRGAQNASNSYASNSCTRGDRSAYMNSLERISETPPRAQETYQNLQLVKPKALIPINSERALPNPYHNDSEDSLELRNKNVNEYDAKTIDRNLNTNDTKEHPSKSPNVRPYFDDTYGTVFDSIERRPSSRNNSPATPPGVRFGTIRNPSPQGRPMSSSASSSSSPRSPSLEGSKLRLPPNRERVELQPRIKSPIPQAKVSTDKIIATELLRTARSPTPTRKSQNSRSSPSHQRLEIQIDYPEPVRTPDTSKISAGSNEDSRISYDQQNSLRRSPAFHSTPKSNGVPSPVKSKPPVSPKKPTVEQYLEAAEWQRKQKEIDQFPTVPVQPQQLVTSAVVHADTNRVSLPSTTQMRPATPKQAVRASPSLNQMLFVNGERPVTPVNTRLSPSTVKMSPEKQEIRQHVEAFCWKELKKLKEKEEMELYFYHLQTYGYADDSILARRSRNQTPNSSRGGRRSLSLPREVRPAKVPQQPLYINNERVYQQQPAYRSLSRNQQHHGLPKTVSPTRGEPQYGQFQQNFIRNTPERRTIGPIGISSQHKNLYENYYPTNGSMQRPIFNRGSLNNQYFTDNQGQTLKKVSFSNRQGDYNVEYWPTKNGYTQSPPQRRLEKRENAVDEDVFLPPSKNGTPNAVADNVDYRKPGLRQDLYANNNPRHQDPIYGQRATIADGNYGYPTNENRQDIYGVRPGYPQRPMSEQTYGKTVTKQVTVSNKYCDIYGKIHDTNDPQGKYGVIQKSGVVYGQLLPNPNMNGVSPVALRHPHSNFIRGSRLTASANDMYKRYNNAPDPRYRSDTVFDPIYEAQAYRYRGMNQAGPPNRPLPPVPNERRSSLASRRPRAMPVASDTESDTSEFRRIVQPPPSAQYRINRGGK